MSEISHKRDVFQADMLSLVVIFIDYWHTYVSLENIIHKSQQIIVDEVPLLVFESCLFALAVQLITSLLMVPKKLEELKSIKFVLLLIDS